MNPKQVTTPSGSERSLSTGRGKDGVSSAFLKARFMTYKRRVWANYLPLVNSDWHENGHGNLSAPVLFLTNLLNTFTHPITSRRRSLLVPPRKPTIGCNVYLTANRFTCTGLVQKQWNKTFSMRAISTTYISIPLQPCSCSSLKWVGGGNSIWKY